MAILIDSYWNGTDSRLGMDSDNDQVGQSFTASENYTTTTVWVKLQRAGTLTTATLGIYAVDVNGFPTGAVLDSDIVDVSGISTGVTGETVIFTLAATLTSGIKYVLVLTSVGLAYNKILYWRGVGTGAKAGGEALYNSDGGGWASYHPRDLRFRVYGDLSLPTAPTTPSPENDATEVDFSALGLSWVDGGGASTYNVYMGPVGDLSLISSAQVGTSLTVDMEDVPLNQVIYWRVDATNSTGTTTGDTWNFDARPGAPINPIPGHDSSTTTLDDTLVVWEAGSANTTTFDVYFRPFGEFYDLIGSDITDLFVSTREGVSDPYYHYGWLYFWYVIAKNDFGYYEGDEWYFNAMVFDPPLPSGVTLSYAGDDDGVPTGTPTGEDNIMTIKKLVAAANGKIWYEQI